MSDSNGHFKITYRVGNAAQMRTIKDGYMSAHQFEGPGDGVAIKMLKGENRTDITYDCRLQSECLVKSIEDGVLVQRNTCFQ